MPFDPKIHHRRSVRLRGYDYSQAGVYFITICCESMICRFGSVVNDKMVLSEFGNSAYEEWVNLAKRFTNFELDVFQIMPNHMHGIIVLNDSGATPAAAQNDAVDDDISPVGATLAVAQNAVDADDEIEAGSNESAIEEVREGAGASPARTIANNIAAKAIAIGDMVGAYKSLVANNCLKISKSKNERLGKLWHRNYYEHIIRDEKAYQTISDYVINNPANWNDDKFYR